MSLVTADDIIIHDSRHETTWVVRYGKGRSSMPVRAGPEAVITGIGMITSLGDRDHTWAGVLAGRSGIKEITVFCTDNYRIHRGGELDRRCLPQGLDPTCAMGIYGLQAALADAEIEDVENVSLAVGSNMGAVSQLEEFCRSDSYETAFGCRLQTMTDVLAERTGLGGIRITTSVACSSGAAAVGMALDMIRRGTDVVVAGGSDALTEFKFSGHHLLGSMTGEEIRPFDRDRSGMLLGEGAAFLVIENEERARRRGVRVYAKLSGYGLANDAYHMTAPDPEGSGAALAIEQALADAMVKLGEVDHVNAHGTATRLNDVMETKALLQVFGERALQIPVTAVKSMIGHLLGASAAVEAAVTTLSVFHGIVPPTIGLTIVDPECQVDCVVGSARPVSIRTALSNSFGFGGIDACLVISRVDG